MNQKKLTYEELESELATLKQSSALVDLLKSEIKLNNSFLEILFDAIPSPIFYKNYDGIYINCNDAFSNKILGIKKEDIKGKTLFEFPDKISKEHALIYDKKDKELLDSKGVQFYSTTVKCSDDIVRHYNFYKAVFTSDNDESLGIIGIMMDITELKNKEEELKKLAFIDPLTNLFNRRYFIESAKSLLCISNRENTPTSILILDIDDFKVINDTHGHENGDHVILVIANKLQELCRESDIIARWGGEEFVILFPNTKLNGAIKIANKIKNQIASSSISMNYSSSIKVTVSIGVALIDSLDDSFEPSLHKADKALYEAKKNGKNKIVSA